MLSEKAGRVLDFCHHSRMSNIQECIKFAKGIFKNSLIKTENPNDPIKISKLVVLDYDEMLEYSFFSYGVEVVPFTLFGGKEGVSKYYFQTKKLGRVGRYIKNQKNGVFVDVLDNGAFGSISFYKNGKLSRRSKDVGRNGSSSNFFMLGYAIYDFSLNGNVTVNEVKEAWENTKRMCV